MFGRQRRPNPTQKPADKLYLALVDRAREPIFYAALKVPDTIDGRFDLVVLHAFLLLDALNRHGAGGKDLGTRLVTTVFAGFEDALRDLGVGDMGMSRRIKAMADAFYGRLAAYDAAVKRPDELPSTLVRNVFRGEPGREREAEALATYIMLSRETLASGPSASTLLSGHADFGPLPVLSQA